MNVVRVFIMASLAFVRKRHSTPRPPLLLGRNVASYESLSRSFAETLSPFAICAASLYNWADVMSPSPDRYRMEPKILSRVAVRVSSGENRAVRICSNRLVILSRIVSYSLSVLRSAAISMPR